MMILSSKPGALAVAAVVAIVGAALVGSGCRPVGRAPNSPALATPTFPFSIMSFTSFAHAEAFVGFHILRPSSRYPVAFGTTGVRTVRGNVYNSTTEYTYPPLAPESIGVDIAPAAYWIAGALTTGVRTTIGSYAGWLITDNIGFEFSFECGSNAKGPVWCVVQTSSDIGLVAFKEFVSSLK